MLGGLLVFLAGILIGSSRQELAEDGLALRDAELAHDRRQMAPDGDGREAQAVGDLRGGPATGEHVDDAPFAVGDHAGVAAQAFAALAARNINIRAITTSEIKFSVLIDAAYTELAVRTLHSLYGLDHV